MATYVFGDEFVRMAFAEHEARPEQVRVHPVLDLLGRPVRGDNPLRRPRLAGGGLPGQVDAATGAVRLTSTIGGRNPAHSTGVGKTLLAAQLSTRADVAAWADRVGLARRTPNTRCTVDELHRDLEQIRERRYATDDQENETGIVCLAVPVYLTSPSTPSGAHSISGLTYRTPLSTMVDAVNEVRGILGHLGEGP